MLSMGSIRVFTPAVRYAPQSLGPMSVGENVKCGYKAHLFKLKVSLEEVHIGKYGKELPHS